jgi:hypothetical protein
VGVVRLQCDRLKFGKMEEVSAIAGLDELKLVRQPAVMEHHYKILV